MQTETWKPVPNYNGLYEVSDLGNVRALERRVSFVRKGREQCRVYPAMVLRPGIAKNGYQLVVLSRGNVKWTATVHRLVCEAFHGASDPLKNDVAHSDGNRLNNRADNLRWATRLENVADARRHGTMTVGSRNGSAKLVEADVVSILARLAQGEMHKDLAAEYGVERRAIGAIKSGRFWKHVSLAT